MATTVIAPLSSITVKGLKARTIPILVPLLPISVLGFIPLILHRIDYENIQPYGSYLQSNNIQYYGDAPVAVVELLQWYSGGKVPVNSLLQRYGDSLLSRLENSQIYDIVVMPIAAFDQLYNILNDIARQSNEQEYDIKEYDIVTLGNEQRYSLLSDDSDVQPTTVTSVVGTEEIEIISFNVSGGSSSYALSCQMRVGSSEDYDKCVIGEISTITINGVAFIFKIEGKTRRKVFGGTDYTVSGLSKTCELDVPYSDTLTQAWDTDISARSLIETLAAGFTVNWNILEWIIKANTLFANDESPLAIIKKILDSIGAGITSSPDSELNIDSLYPISPSDWKTETPYITFSDDLEIVQVDESFEFRPGYNAVIVSNENVLSSDHVSITEEIVDENTKKLKVWYLLKGGGIPNFVTLNTSGGSWVTIDSLGQTDEALTEVIEFVDGVGSTNKPIFSYDSATLEWKETNLGAVTFTENGALSSEIKGNSLLDLTYTTRYFTFIVSDPNIEKVQFFIE